MFATEKFIDSQLERKIDCLISKKIMKIRGGPVGYAEEVDFIGYLREDHLMDHVLTFDSWLVGTSPSSGRRNLWISYGDSSRFFPAKACGEEDTSTKDGESMITGTQTYLEVIDRELKSTGYLYLESAEIPGTYIESTAIEFVRTSDPHCKCVSTSDPHSSYKKVSFRKRKPDLVLYRLGCSDPYSITSLGDVGAFDDLQHYNMFFSEEKIARVVCMGIELMRHVQPWRSFLIVFITDTRSWQFFRISRVEGDEFMVDESTVFLDGDGWSIYLSLLMLPLGQLGYSDMSIEGVEAMDLISIGKKYVFSGKIEVKTLKIGADDDNSDVQYVFKVYPEGNDADFEREKSNLLRLADMAGDHEVRRHHLPSLIRSDLMTKETCLKVLMLSPFALKVNPCQNGHAVYGRHIVQLLDVVLYVHKTINFVHRDIKPDNILLSPDKQNIILSDWGSASDCGLEVPYQGTYGFYEKPTSWNRVHVPTFKDDLVAFVRSAFLMLFNDAAPGKNEDLEKFWTSRLTNVQFWRDAVSASNSGDHDSLKELFKIWLEWK